MKSTRAIIIGGGIIGLSVARELARRDYSVCVIDRREVGSEASAAAAGMLAPRLEFTPNDELFGPAMESLALYPDFVREVEGEGACTVDLRLDGIIRPLSDSASRTATAPPGAERITDGALRNFQPGLGDDIRAADFFPGEGSVDNRALVQALADGCRRRGVEIHEHIAVEEVVLAGESVRGVRTQRGEEAADVVVNCAGAWAGQIRVPSAEVEIRPIKGQMLVLHCPPPLVAPRFVLYTHDAYLVPRSDGRVIVGATVEDVGYDKRVEAWAITRHLQRSIELFPSIGEAQVADYWAGLRPQGNQAMPDVGQSGPSGYYVATGHYRNGILLAPWTAKTLGELIG